MRHGAAFVVKRLAPTIGNPEAPRRVSVEHNAYTLDEALNAARGPARRRQALEGMASREGGGGAAWLASKRRELEQTATWIEARGKPATIARRRSAGGEGGR